jgi:hypothetical protein
LTLAAIGSAAAFSWLYLKKSEPGVDEQTRRRLAPRKPAPQSTFEADDANSPS